MKIVWMNGGLGNQAFQYIFYRYLEMKTDDICYIDDSFFFTENVQHNGYEMDSVFGLKPNRLSEYFDRDVWESIVGITSIRNETNIVDLLRTFDLDIQVLTEGSLYAERTGFKGQYYSFPNQYCKDLERIKDNLYCYGYWINAMWFYEIREIILDEFQFPHIDKNDVNNYQLLKLVCTTNSVGVHVRRGDFVNLGWDLPFRWYVKTISKMRQLVHNPVFIIFSDDIDWCKENCINLGFKSSDHIVFAEGNEYGKSYIDMLLMSRCCHLIIANSAFSYLAALLNRNEDKIVFNPRVTRQIV